jgi:hypothetical protein
MADPKLSTRDLTNRQADEDVDQSPAVGGFANDPAIANSDQPLARDPAGDETSADGDSASRDHESLLPADQTERLTAQWQEIQAGFVDHPRDSVAEADALVADLMQRLAASFSHERDQLESQWDRGDDVSTEDLRVALTRYRSFFDRLLSA